MFRLLRAAIDRAGQAATIGQSAIDRAIAGQRRTLRHGLNDGHWRVLSEAATTFNVDTTNTEVAGLLRTSRILPYVSADRSQWYGVHPLLLDDDGHAQR